MNPVKNRAHALRARRASGRAISNGMKQKVLIIVGPTSSGKSALAIELARTFKGEVISADSRQVYKGLDIGTGKITKREMKGVRHHLLDVASPKKTFTAHDFVERAHTAIADISRRGKLPIVAGGTGFYIDALVGRITLPNVKIDLKLRRMLSKKSAVQLFAMLRKRDPRRAKTIEPHNTRRLIRALEIVAALGKVPTNASAHRPPRYDALWLGMTLQSKVIKNRIKARLSQRIRRGLIAEARRLRRGGLSFTRMRAFGLEYRALADLLKRKLSRRDFEKRLNHDISRYAKRQITYWRRNSDIRWVSSSSQQRIPRVIRRWLKQAEAGGF